MSQTFFFIFAVVVTFVGCAVLFIDAVITKKTDYCQEKTPAEYKGATAHALSLSKNTNFLVLAVPKFSYEFEKKQYEGYSANVFFHVFVGKKGLAVPFLQGKNYYIYVNPAQPEMYVTDGEQRAAFLHIVGCGIAALGLVMLCFAVGIFG